MRLVTVIVIFGILLLISIVDFKIHMIPDQLNMLLFLAGIWSSFVFQKITITGRVFGIFVVSIPFFIIAVLSSGGLGGGDIKLMAASGMLVGVTGNVFAACFGLLLGGFCGLFLLLTKRIGYKECFALGPFLCLGIAIVFFQINFLQ